MFKPDDKESPPAPDVGSYQNSLSTLVDALKKRNAKARHKSKDQKTRNKRKVSEVLAKIMAQDGDG